MCPFSLRTFPFFSPCFPRIFSVSRRLSVFLLPPAWGTSLSHPFPLSLAHVYIIMCPFPFLPLLPFLFLPPDSFVIQPFKPFPVFSFKKVPCIFCDVSRKFYFCIRFRQRGHGCFDMMVCRMPQAAFVFLYFPPLSHRERRREIKKEKNFRNNLEDTDKSSYLCIRFPVGVGTIDL